MAFAIERFVTVLVIACPHALGLAVPLVVAISTTIGARSGLLVRDRRGLEEARLLDTVVFDKTGTLTLGEHRVVAMLATSGEDRERGAAPGRRRRTGCRASGGTRHRRAAKERDLDLPGGSDSPRFRDSAQKHWSKADA